ncbi:hypothetical protein CLORY_36400 [Clostridium oryzae]|uniref:Uncharacterized protein n=1 Tax=Clostridium oryzae TaxID=1450648 RepID=A0A1V4IEI4_9CLOT|nr:hypothetical protein CLORY_36400 [Clostridium oryzae]
MKQRRNVSVKFVNTVPPDIIPILGSSVLKKKNSLLFLVMAPYSLEDKFETPDTQVTKGFTVRSKHPTQSTDEMKTMIQDARIAASYNLLNFSEILDQNRNMIFIGYKKFNFIFLLVFYIYGSIILFILKINIIYCVFYK